MFGEFGVVAEPEVAFSEAGNCWMKIRGGARKSVRDATTGQWTDGDPCYIDIIIFGKQAENLVDSVRMGDAIIVSGRLEMQTWDDKNTGEKRQGYRVVAEEAGVSVRRHAAKTPRALGTDEKPADAAPAPSDPPF